MKKITSLLMLSLITFMGGGTKAFAGIGEAYNTADWTINASSTAPISGNEGGINFAFDGKKETYWHSNWSSDKTDPKWIVIDTQNPETSLGGITYLPRQDSDNGIWLKYKIYVSNTPFENLTKESVGQLGTTNLKKEGSLEKNRELKRISFDKEEKGQYILIVITEGNGNNNGKHATCAELTINKFTTTANVTYQYQFEGQIKKEITVEQGVGLAYNAPAIDFVTFKQPSGTIPAEGGSVVVTCTENLPFEKTTTLSAPKWLSIDMHSNQNRYMWHYDGDNTNIKVAVPKDLVSISKDDAYFWCLTGNVFDGFKIYNKKAGTNKTLNTTSGKPQFTKSEATVWQIVKPQSTVTNAACFKAEGTNFLNHQGDNTLGYWVNPDGGSSCRFFKPAALAMEQCEVYAHIPENAVGGFVGVENIDPALTEAENNPYDFNKVNKLVDAIKALKSNNITLEAGQYYRLVNRRDGKFLTIKKEGANYIMHDAATPTSASSVVQFVPNGTEGQYTLKLQGLNFGRVTRSQNIQLLSSTDAIGCYTVENIGEACHRIQDVSVEEDKAYHFLHVNGGNAVGWAANSVTNNAPSFWYLVPAENVEVPLANVGNASYATAYLPFAVSNVTGATAFVGKKAAEGNALNMTSVAFIPANTGVVLKGAKDAGKAVLTIGAVTGIVAENALSGTHVEKDHAGELVLGNHDEKIGFYGMTPGAKIGANKAFLPATASGAQGFVLNFDGEATAIESVMGETNTDAPVYDLSGRRVVKTVKGGLYIQNGKKFIVR